MQPFQVILSLVVIVVILIACYYTTYYISAKASGQSRGRLKTKNINLVDRYSIARDKSFCIVEIAGKVYVLGVTNQTITLIDTLDAAAFNEAAAERHDMASKRSVQSGGLRGRLVSRMADFIASRTGRMRTSGDRATDQGGVSFAESMKTASAKQTDDSEVKGKANNSDEFTQ